MPVDRTIYPEKLKESDEQAITKKLSGDQIKVISLCSLAVFLDGYDVQALGLAIPRLAEEFSIAPTAFAGALSGSLVGMALGAILLSPMADNFGRRKMLIWMMLLIGITTIGAIFSSSPNELLIWRVISGFGLGATVPIAIALTSEYAPVHRRVALVTLMVSCTAVGSFCAGIVAPVLDATWGWRGIFGLGAILPLMAAIMFYFFLPESQRFKKKVHVNSISCGSSIPSEIERTLIDEKSSSGVKMLFSPLLLHRTCLLWSIYWLNLFVNYSLISWLPTLLRNAGWSHESSMRFGGVVALGGILGGLTLSYLADRGHSIKALITAYVLTAVLLVLFVVGPNLVWVWVILLFLVGAGAIGSQITIGSLTASYYPVAVRSTGLGWAGGAGRIGSVFGPLALAGLMQWNTPPALILSTLMLPMLLCAICVSLLPGALQKTGY
jgi:AAHS family 4-hydroxybenzoate transporter-like MFS transporter